MKIYLLPEDTIRKISSGEFINRPYKILKELLENSIDALSNEIKIYLFNFGLDIIKVIDNGIGISKIDILNTIKRHFTSKIYYFKDLSKINTFGFRGEALSCISSISNFNIISKTKKQDYGWNLFNEENNFLKFNIKPFLCNKGTIVLVKNIFSNIPILRNKLLLQKYNEWLLLRKLIYNFILCNHNINFYIYKNNNLFRKYISLNNVNKDIKLRISSIYNKNIFVNCLSINIKNFYFCCYGYFFFDYNTIKIIFLNKRIISNKNLLYFIINNFVENFFFYKKYSYILYFNISNIYLNINIVPDKTEISFLDSSFWLKKIYKEFCLYFRYKKIITILNKKKKYNNYDNICYKTDIYYFIKKFGFILYNINSYYLCSYIKSKIFVFNLFRIFNYINLMILRKNDNNFLIIKNINPLIFFVNCNLVNYNIIYLLNKIGLGIFYKNKKIILRYVSLFFLNIKYKLFFKRFFSFLENIYYDKYIYKKIIFWISKYLIYINNWNNYKSMILISNFYRLYNEKNKKNIFFYIFNLKKIFLYMLIK